MKLHDWLNTATPEQKRLLARSAKTSVHTLRHVASGFRKGSAELAIRISRAAATLAAKGEVSHPIEQASICPACRKCPHYPKADGAR